MIMVVQKYTAKVPDNPLARYLPALGQIDKKFVASNYSDIASTKGLDGLPQAWHKAAADDPKFRDAQDKVVNELYLNPAITRAEAVGVNSAVGQLIIFDTILQQGEGNDPDGLPAVMSETVHKFPPKDYSETAWLEHFLNVRKYHLLHPAKVNAASATGWKQSVGRVNALREILSSNNPDLRKPIKWYVNKGHFSLPAA